MKIYLAARYSRAAEMRDVRADLQSLGHTVTARWINGGHELKRDEPNVDEERARWAQDDFDDLWEADLVISFTEEPRKTSSRGGRHVEFGLALGLKKNLIVVGHRENVFHCLPEVEFYPMWEMALGVFRQEAGRGVIDTIAALS
jgi:hypothetical protein